jgi:hypothetical protein
MKKILLTIFIAAILAWGCAGLKPATPPSVLSDIEDMHMRLAVLERSQGVSPDKLMDLLEQSAVNKIRAFTGLTGDTTGTLDKIDIADLTDEDIGLVFTPAGGIYFYSFDATDTTVTNSPYSIRPNDYVDQGVWLLQSGFYMGRTALPANVFRDSNATDFDINARIYANCDDGDCTSGTEDVDLYIQVQVGGTENTTIMHIDCDASGNCDIDFSPQGTGNFDFSDADIANVGIISADEINADAATLTAGQGDEETIVLGDANPDSDDTYTCFSSLAGITAGEAISQFDAVYMNSTDGEWHQADATTVNNEWPAVGFAVGCSGAWSCDGPETVTVCLNGVIRNDGWTFTDHGAILYLSETAGGITETAPSDSGDAIQALGIAIRSETAGDSEDVLLFPVPAWGEDDGS